MKHQILYIKNGFIGLGCSSAACVKPWNEYLAPENEMGERDMEGEREKERERERKRERREGGGREFMGRDEGYSLLFGRVFR